MSDEERPQQETGETELESRLRAVGIVPGQNEPSLVNLSRVHTGEPEQVSTLRAFKYVNLRGALLDGVRRPLDAAVDRAFMRAAEGVL